MVKMRRGDSRSFNNWLRVRVIAQGLTVAAMVAGTYTFGTKNTEAHKTQTEADRLQRIEERKERDKQEFEQRLKDAEEAHRAEVEIVQGAGVSASETQKSAREKLEEMARAQAGQTWPEDTATTASSSSKSSWWRFGK
ncbi:hypothetical protein HGRIS_012471 [Hohenbuehelia grisea]|uniref:HIG1 domain-containing protein n=1 Tax=Hohenbuehelia grisea TaxID=104357 RepID=A0ABR3ISF8_9AGAR